MAANDGFWSYVHDDDDASFGKIVQLGNDLRNVYQMVTGEAVELFIDRESLEWGDAWESVIHNRLGKVAFFIPVITPAYFQHAACRTELERFAERTSSEGLKGLLLPILWIDGGQLEDGASDDPLVQIVKDRQWEDWTDLRHEERGSPAYSRTLEKMAKRIRKANREADSAEAAVLHSNITAVDEGDAVDEDGRLEKLAKMEEAVQLWLDDLTSVAEGLRTMGEIAEARTVELNTDPRARTFAGRLTLVRKIATDLQAPAKQVEDAGAAFAKKVSSVDEGVRIIIESAPAEIASDPEAAEQFDGFFAQLRELDAVTTTVHEQLGGFVDSIAPLQAQSRDLKKPVQSATAGVTRIQAAIGIIHDWISLIEDGE